MRLAVGVWHESLFICDFCGTQSILGVQIFLRLAE
jgi:hypothetical protein